MSGGTAGGTSAVSGERRGAVEGACRTWINRLIEAKRFLAKNAILAVHSFSAQQDGFSDFQAFARQFGASVSNPGELVHAGTVSDVELFLGWAQGPVAVTPPTVG